MQSKGCRLFVLFRTCVDSKNIRTKSGKLSMPRVYIFGQHNFITEMHKQPLLKLRPYEELMVKHTLLYTEELQWLKHLSDHENMFEIGVVRANEC